MAPISEPSHLINPIASSLQLETSASHLDGVPGDIEDAMRYELARLIQAAGILMRLPQEIIAQSIVILQRFLIGPDGGSLMEIDAGDIAAAALYLAAKPSDHSISPRRTLTVLQYLKTVHPYDHGISINDDKIHAEWRLSEGDYETARNRLYGIEIRILRVIGFQTHVALPYNICINYLQILEVSQSDNVSRIAKSAFAYLNSALLSPQMLYLTHQPSAIATASIYLAARQLRVKLPEVEWWEVFDVDREELGFLVVALQSLEGFVRGGALEWVQGKAPLTVDELRFEIERRKILEPGE